MKNFVTYDLETLSTDPTTVILSMSIVGGSFEEFFTTTAAYPSIKAMCKLLFKDSEFGLVVDEKYKEKVLRQFSIIIENIKKSIYHVAYDADEQIELGFKVDDSVMKFWESNAEAYMRTYGEVEPKQDIRQIYDNVVKYLHSIGYQEGKSRDSHIVWIRAPHFDDPIIKSVCSWAKGIENLVPYNPYKVRDVRTIVDAAFGRVGDLKGYVDVQFSDGESFFDSLGFVAHDSVDDICRDTILIFLSLNKLDLI